MRHRHRIGHEVVHEGPAHRRGIAEEVDLHGRGPQPQDLRPAVAGPAYQVHQHVDAVRVDATRRVRVAGRGQVHEVLGVLFDPAAVPRPVVGAVRVREGLDARAIVAAEEALREVADRALLRKSHER